MNVLTLNVFTSENEKGRIRCSDITEQIEDIYFNVLTLNIEFISRDKILIFSRLQSTGENIEKSCPTRELNPNSKSTH